MKRVELGPLSPYSWRPAQHRVTSVCRVNDCHTQLGLGFKTQGSSLLVDANTSQGNSWQILNLSANRAHRAPAQPQPEQEEKAAVMVRKSTGY